MRFLLLIITLLVGSSPAFAHRLLVAPPKVDGDRLRVEAYYQDDTPAQEAKVIILLGDEVVVEGTTDEKGVWTGPCPKPGTYTVRVVSTGHRADATLVVPEPDAPPAQATDDDRSHQTRTPWGRLGIGLALIAGLGVAWRISRRTMGKAE